MAQGPGFRGLGLALGHLMSHLMRVVGSLGVGRGDLIGHRLLFWESW